MHLHATVTARPGRLSELVETTAWIARGMTGRGWSLVGSYQSLDPQRELIIDVWEMADANAVVNAFEEAFRHPAHDKILARLAESVERELLRLVVPTPYGPPLPTNASCTRFLHSTITVRYGSVGKAEEAVCTVREVLEKAEGWRLVGGFRTLIGDLGDLFHIWELPSDVPVDTMIARAMNDPAFATAAAQIEALVEQHERIEVERTSFAPAGWPLVPSRR